MNKILKVKCPHCATEFSYYESEFRPFCTEKCRLIDLGHWFKETYAVPVKDQAAQVESEESETNIDQDEENNESEYH